MCSRASRRVAESFSFWDSAWASWPFVSRSRSSRVRTRLGASWSRRRSCDDLVFEACQLGPEFGDFLLVLGGQGHPLTLWPDGRAPMIWENTPELAGPAHA